MELKSPIGVLQSVSKVSSNRTFMELKFEILSYIYQLLVVLIAPLWN